MKSGSLNLLEPSGPHRACYGTALPLPFNHLQKEQQTTQTSIRRSGATGLALGNSTVSAHPYGQHHPIVIITSITNPHETQQSNLCTFRFTPSSYILRPSAGRYNILAQEEKCSSLCTLKADSHIACRAHAAPMPFPCHAAKDLECVFPI